LGKKKKGSDSDVISLDNKKKPEEMEPAWKISVDTMCEKCMTEASPRKATLAVSQYKTYGSLKRYLDNLIHASLHDLQKKAKAKAKQDKLHEQCRIDDDNQPITGQARTECFVEKLSNMDDDKKAAAYYDKNLKGEIKRLLESPNAADQAQAKKLIASLGQKSLSNYIQASLTDLTKYGVAYQQMQGHQAKVNKLAAMINSLPANDPRRRALLRQLNSEKMQLNSLKAQNGFYFGKRGNDLSMVASDAYTTRLITDINVYQQDLDARYNSIVSNAWQLNTQSVNGTAQAANSNPRVRGSVTPFPRAGATGAPNVITAQSVKPGTQAVVQTGQYQIPRLGSPVSAAPTQLPARPAR
jgi:hypothetical protein